MVHLGPPRRLAVMLALTLGGVGLSAGPVGASPGPVPGDVPAPLGATLTGGLAVSHQDDAPPVPGTRNPETLSPRAGAGFPTHRPRLDWPDHPGATQYNLQIFLIRRGAVEKVLSEFPQKSTLRVPSGVLETGERYAWRMWPFDGRRLLTEQPIGLSYFDVTAPPPGAGFSLSVQQLRINQRISQAAVRRVNALEATIEGRPPSAREPEGDRLALTVQQLRINQRISQAALRRVNALEARVEGRPPPPDGEREGDRLALSVEQLRINQRISQAAVRRVNELAEQIAASGG